MSRKTTCFCGESKVGEKGQGRKGAGEQRGRGAEGVKWKAECWSNGVLEIIAWCGGGVIWDVI